MTLCSLLAITECKTECSIFSKDGKRIVEGRDSDLLIYLHPELLELDVWAITLQTSFRGPNMVINIDKTMGQLSELSIEWGD